MLMAEASVMMAIDNFMAAVMYPYCCMISRQWLLGPQSREGFA